MTLFSMPCPTCETDVDDIKATVTEGHRTEHFWGAPVSIDESECEVDSIPECPDCGRRTIDPDEAADYFWDKVYA